MCLEVAQLIVLLLLPCYTVRTTYQYMIKSFKCKYTEKLHDRKPVRQFNAFYRVAQRKLTMIQAASVLSDLGSPPGNELEALSGDRKGQHSIRINKQWRICFVWKDRGAHNVEITDYH